jgi:hypothetical protein
MYPERTVMMRERIGVGRMSVTSTVGGCGMPPEEGGFAGAVTFLFVRAALGLLSHGND